MCTSLMASCVAKVPDLEQRVALAFVARSPIARLVETRNARGWGRLPVYSDPSGDFTRAYVSAEDADVPGLHGLQPPRRHHPPLLERRDQWRDGRPGPGPARRARPRSAVDRCSTLTPGGPRRRPGIPSSSIPRLRRRSSPGRTDPPQAGRSALSRAAGGFCLIRQPNHPNIARMTAEGRWNDLGEDTNAHRHAPRGGPAAGRRRSGAGLSDQADHLRRAVLGRRADRHGDPAHRRADAQALGQQIVVQNVGGAGGTLGAGQVAGRRRRLHGADAPYRHVDGAAPLRRPALRSARGLRADRPRHRGADDDRRPQGLRAEHAAGAGRLREGERRDRHLRQCRHRRRLAALRPAVHGGDRHAR